MASIQIVLRKKAKVNGTYPVYLRITINRKSKYFKTIFNCHENDWDYNSGQFKNSERHIQSNRLLLKFKDRALDIYSQLKLKNDNFTLLDFEKAYRVSMNPLSKDLLEFWQELISELITAGRTGNARMHRNSFTSFRNFIKKKRLSFEELNVSLLSKYEADLRSRGGTDGGISVKMRALRTLYNTAIQRDLVAGDNYPFNKYKISKLKGKGAKKALSIEEIKTIIDLNIDQYPELFDSHNYFVFSFYTRGMNFADIMKLTWDNVKNDHIHYVRSKTKGNFQIKILPPIEKILNHYRKNTIGTKYVFPILLSDNLSPSQVENRKNKILKKFNGDLKEIAFHCKIDKPLTSYVARHSFANCLKQKGVATDIISESLGHQNLAVTQAYLKDMDSSVLDAASALLL
ncbi:site-specific integrase [Arenibacter certesii]|uniref:Tyrosine recombinase n=1 Tax=Arenibacter certesii TaxID=228955 RepID=A0A918MMC8_9FLAO|nr:site-specific integrase [Arenibacter certesii]GGW36037.1 tyrosine recombinase [Arenibacter certesii]